VDLERPVRDAACHLRTEIFRARCLDHRLALAVVFLGRRAHERAAGRQFRLAVGQQALDELMLGDRHAELPPLHRILDGKIQHPLRRAHRHRGDMRPPAIEHFHGRAEALAKVLHAADDGRRRHAHFLQNHIAGLGAALAEFAIRLGDGDAGRARRKQERRYAGCTGFIGIGAGEQCEHVGAHGIGDVALGAVDDEIIAVAPRVGADMGGIRAVVRLGQREGRHQFATGKAGQIGLLLLRRSIHHNALGADADVGADERPERQRRIAELFDQHRFLKGA
jgi:hypothetical protein